MILNEIFADTRLYLTESAIKNPGKIIKDFLTFTAKSLELSSLPNIKLKRSLISVHTQHPTFGFYDPNTQIINVAVGERHPLDSMRTLAHELVHHRQRLDNQTKKHSGNTGSPMENDANARAGVIMRNFADQHPEYFVIS